ncbi:embryogenic cell protein 40-like [Cynara cardunculus var. scolymus]|uniref:Dehydrin n=1 Tax=Cynara cardunculus var. scolymus TaxID=59895 RepID=A0A103Y3V0_CYNCS|nr:embryogenic cell protein 40-like [Cynara cardunculus var. scolymus]KVI02014.1 Dehydrin [Cynara cardunculus var. scolymus]
MADILDEQGNPVQLTDELGRSVKLTDERGVPIHLIGVATPEDSSPLGSTTTIGTKPEMHGETHFAPVPTDTVGGGGIETTMPPLSHPETGGDETKKQQLGRAGSSSSSSSEDDGEGGRRKKKGLMQKIKEKLPGHKSKEDEVPAKVYTATTKVSVTTPAGPADQPKPEFIKVEHHEEEHEKKGFMDKIMDKLPGHHAR